MRYSFEFLIRGLLHSDLPVELASHEIPAGIYPQEDKQ